MEFPVFPLVKRGGAFWLEGVNTTDSPRAAVLGLGIIGESWAANLRADGVLGAVWNRTPRPDLPEFVSTPAETAAKAEVLIVVVADPAAVESVLSQLVPALTSRHTVVQSSTIDPAASDRFAALVEATGAHYLESPFTGSKPAAKDRKTVFYQGGEAGDIARAEPILSRLSQARLAIGTRAQACALKLAMNVQVALLNEALGESLRMSRAAGISDDTYFACLARNVAQSGVATLKEPKLRGADWSPQFSVKHMRKDLRLALASWGPHLPVTAALEKQYGEAVARGQADEDMCSLYKLLG